MTAEPQSPSFMGLHTALQLDKLAAVTLLLRPCEVLSRIPHPTILEVADNSFWGFVEHRHMLVGRLA